MQAYYEIETDIPPSHQLSLMLPDEIPEGKAKVAVIYELPSISKNNSKEVIEAIKNFRVKKTLSREEIKQLCEEGREC